MDELLTATMETIEKKCRLAPLPIASELERTAYPFGLLKLRYYNWTSDRIRKMYAMRMTMKLFPLDILGIGIFPKYEYDAPIFIYDLSAMRNKIVTYINSVPMVHDTGRMDFHIEPLKDIHEKYRHLPPYPKIADWFKELHTPYTIYALPEISAIDDVKNASLEYLQVYMDRLYEAGPLEDEHQINAVKGAQTAYCRNMFENDSSRKMLGRIIGMKKTNRIFHKVLT